MKKFILGFVTALALIGVGYGVYYFLTPRDFGDLKVTATSNGKPVTGLEIDVDKNPGPPKYRIDTDENGIALFEKLPVGSYAVFFNDASFPSERLEKPEGGIIWVDVAKDQMTETKIELKAVKDVFPNACTMEAKKCPDGSYVGRTGPNCEFTPCGQAQSGKIKGVVLLGPTCPVQKIPPDPACADKPYKTTVQVIKINSPQSAPFATTKSNDQGQYEITLPTGEYALQPVGGSPLPRCETKEATVEPNKTEEIDLSCDTGIR